MRLLPLLATVFLMSCNSPSPQMVTADRHDVQIEGFAFTVWRRDKHVEIIRHNFVRVRHQSNLRGLMVQAAQQATGCKLRPESITGDTGVLRAELDCD